jgi:hypothetical protein
MRGMMKVACLALSISSPLAVVRAVAQNATIRLSPISAVRKGVDAWPLIQEPKTDAERRINGYMRDLNADLSRRLKECDAAYAGSPMGKEHPSPADDDEGTESWRQDVKVTMTGPAFLSLVANADFYCGGAHPYGFTSVAVFDLRTGKPADPLAWFLPSSNASLAPQDEDDSLLENSVVAAGLLQAYKVATRHECDNTYSDDQSFLVWPDAKSGTVMIQADRLPGCCEACGIAIGLTLGQVRTLGFAETFLQAIKIAHDSWPSVTHSSGSSD